MTETNRPTLFLDANILYSAAWKDDAAAKLLFDLAAAGWRSLTTSHLAQEEAIRNLSIKRPEQLTILEQLIKKPSPTAEPRKKHLELAARHGLPDKDVPILAAALLSRVDLLVTGDRRDFGHLYGHTIQEVEVVGLSGAIERVIEAKKL